MKAIYYFLKLLTNFVLKIILHNINTFRITLVYQIFFVNDSLMTAKVTMIIHDLCKTLKVINEHEETFEKHKYLP